MKLLTQSVGYLSFSSFSSPATTLSGEFLDETVGVVLALSVLFDDEHAGEKSGDVLTKDTRCEERTHRQ